MQVITKIIKKQVEEKQKEIITALSPLRKGKDKSDIPFPLPKFRFLKNNNGGRNSQRAEFQKMMAPISLFSDASSEGGNGDSYCSALLRINGQTKTHRLISLGEMDNNIAEFYGLFTAISLVSSVCTSQLYKNTTYKEEVLRKKHICFYTDSKFILKKVHAVLNKKEEEHHPDGIALAYNVIKGFQLLQQHLDLESHLVWIPRYLNPHADSLSKQRF
jgi:ribonuclease HI